MRKKTLSPLLRSFAAVALVGFIVAQTLCFIHCHFGDGHGDSTPPPCHSRATTQAQACHDEDGSSSPIPSATTSCFTLQNLQLGANAPTLVVPEFQTLYTLAPLALARDVTATAPGACFSRHPRPHDWVLTPEVSLGPAFRSLAPPFIA
ncbi:MAG: hypothetical protein L0Z50_26910 [Verrucomicrobiales bacterium]|nr:hypothetical protein [Verrucomicrobiales bacterium]